MRSAISCLAFLLLCTQGGCLHPPKQNYSPDQIPQIDKLEEVMRVQAATMDPLFKKRGQPSFTQDEFAAMVAGAQKIQASSATVRDKFSAGRKPGFQTYAGDLNKHAGELLAAAQAGDATQAGAALSAARDTCRGCHREYR